MSNEQTKGQRLWMWLARRRTPVQLLSALTLNSYFTQRITKGLPCPALNCYACPAAAFACPIGSIQNFVGGHKLPLYVLGTVGLVGALVGRGSCGWLCPFGWLQELVHKIPVPKLRLPNRFNWTRYVVLAVLVVIIPFITNVPWFCKLCPAGSLEAGIPQALLYDYIREQIGWFYWLKIAILVGFIAWMSVTRRPFCRWVCPLGTLWSPFNAVSAMRLEVDGAACTRCNRCQEVCPVNIRIYESPNDGACVRCLACARVCPQNAIAMRSLNWSLEADRAGAPAQADG
jgi:ferredoxin-type protein NapH